MKYEPVELPINLSLKDPIHLRFRVLSRKEARMHYDWFLSEMPQRIIALQKVIQSSSGLEQWNADYSSASLDGLGKWLSQNVAERLRTKAEIEEIYATIP